MEDELTTPTPEAPVVEEPTEPDPVAEKVKSLDEETLKHLENLDEFYKKTNQKSREAAEAQRKAEEMLAEARALLSKAQPEAKAIEMSDEEREVIEKKILPIVEQRVAERYGMLAQSIEAELLEVRDEFLSSHDDVDADVLLATAKRMAPEGPITPNRLKKAMQEAHDYLTTKSVDVEAKARELAEKMVEELKAGGEVIEVKPKRTVIDDAPKDLVDELQDDSVPWFKKMDFLTKQG